MKTLEINEIQLFNIPQLTEHLERTDPSVKEAGVFKVVLPSSVRSEGTSLYELLSLANCRERLSVSEKQFIVAFSNCPNLYGHSSFGTDLVGSPCTTEEANEFVNSVLSPKTWENQETCCTATLNGDQPEELVNHYFHNVIPKLAGRKGQACKKQQKLSASISQGKRDSASVKRFMTGLAAMPPEQRCALIEKSLLNDKRSFKETCECGGCSIDTDHMPEQGVMYGKGVEVLVPDKIRMSKSFGLYCLPSTSLLRLLKHKYEGITMPFLYFGALHSFFPAHIEDFSLYSWNYLHFGKPKIWIVVPPTAAMKLTVSIMNASPHLAHSSCINLLGHKYFIPTPEWLQEHGIPFKVIIQEEGQSVIVCPNAVHWGWNAGYNIAEACNFATTSWVPFGIVAPKCSCMGGEVHMDLQRLIAASRPDLLQCYLKKSVPMGEDDIYYKSILRINDRSLIPQTDADKEEKMTDEEDVPSVDDTIEDGSLFPEVPKKKTWRKTVSCSVPLCGVQYKYGSKEKLLRHINNKHKEPKVHSDAMEHFNLLFPERNKYVKKRCCLCEKMIGGRGAAMKRHQRSSGCGKNSK